MQCAYARGVKNPSRRRLIRQENLDRLIEEAGGVTALALLLDTHKSHLSAMRNGSRGVGDELAERMESVMDKGAGWMDQQHAPEGVIVPPVAHDMSLPKHSDALLEITWESLMGNVPDSLFVLALRDDALAPDFPRGTAVVWSKTREPRPGRLVLIRDQHGQHHARIVHQGTAPGSWTAIATRRGFADFDPAADGVLVLAAHKGVLDADD